MDWTTGDRFPAVVRDLSIFHSIQAGAGVHPTCYPMGTRHFFPGGKAAGLEAAEIKNGEVIPPLPKTSLWALHY
jgi:hypothetical protein